MNTRQVARFVMRYLEATSCHIIEKSPAHVTVKLSPEADKALTGRTYYWGFVERTGAAPETMTFTFIFDPAVYGATAISGQKPNLPINTSPLGAIRIPQDNVTFGSGRLEQLFQQVKSNGRYVLLFEEPDKPFTSRIAHPPKVQNYSPWLAINFKAEFTCDMKREELHSLGISLVTGQIIENFHSILLGKKLTQRLPAGTVIPSGNLNLGKAAVLLEQTLEQRISQYDHNWASEALNRWIDEQRRIDFYYENLINASNEEEKPDIQAQYEQRKLEIEWQYRPRIQLFVINCGIFHLHSAPVATSDAYLQQTAKNT